MPNEGLTFLHVATNFGSRPGVGLDESAPGQNCRRNASWPKKGMRLKLHRSAQTEVVVLGDYAFGVKDSANWLNRFTTGRACQQLREAGQVDPHVKSGARQIRLVIEFGAVVTFSVRLIVELSLKRTAVDFASIPDEINPFANGCVHFCYSERNCSLHRKPPSHAIFGGSCARRNTTTLFQHHTKPNKMPPAGTSARSSGVLDRWTSRRSKLHIG